MEDVLKKKAIKWNLVLHYTLEMPDKYHEDPMRTTVYFRSAYLACPRKELFVFTATLIVQCLHRTNCNRTGWSCE